MYLSNWCTKFRDTFNGRTVFRTLQDFFQWSYTGVWAAFLYCSGLALWGVALSTDPYVPLFKASALACGIGGLWLIGFVWTRENRVRGRGVSLAARIPWKQNTFYTILILAILLQTGLWLKTSFTQRWMTKNHTAVKVRGFEVKTLETGKEVEVRQFFATIGPSHIAFKVLANLWLVPTVKDDTEGNRLDNELFNRVYGGADVSAELAEPSDFKGDDSDYAIRHHSEYRLTEDERQRVLAGELSIYVVGVDRYKDATGCWESTYCAFKTGHMSGFSVCANHNVDDQSLSCSKFAVRKSWSLKKPRHRIPE